MERKISPYQLLSTMFILPYGSAVLFLLVPDAKQDSWFSILAYIPLAILLQSIYIKLFEYYKEDSLVTYLPKIFGRFLGSILSIIYILYFTYLSARVLRDFSGLISISSMPQTSTLFIASLIIITVIYGVITGFETIARAAEILFPLMIIGLFLAILLLFITKNIIIWGRLQPVFENGIIYPIIKGWSLITFPFGETVAFTMLYKNLNEPKKIYKAAFLSITTLGIVLSIINAMFTTSLGVGYSSITFFPLLESLRLIRVGGFLDRLDILIIVTMVVAGFMKISIFMYTAVLGISEFFNIKSRNTTAVILGIIILISSELIAKSFPQHVQIGLDFTVKYIHLPLIIFVPITALVIAYFKNKPSKRKKLKMKNEE